MKKGLEERIELPNTDLRKRLSILLACFVFSSILVTICCGNSIMDLKSLGPLYRNIDIVVIQSMRKDLKIIYLVLFGLLITILFLNRKEKVIKEKSSIKTYSVTFFFIIAFIIFNLVSYRNYIIFSKDTKISMREKRFEDFILCRRTHECKKYLDKVMAVHQEFMITEYELKKRNRSTDKEYDFRGEAQSYTFLTSY